MAGDSDSATESTTVVFAVAKGDQHGEGERLETRRQSVKPRRRRGRRGYFFGGGC
jgi:hypothetical protein